MTIEEAGIRYNIPVSVLQEYKSRGRCSEVKKVMGDWHYDQTDNEHLSLIITLHDVGFEKEEVEHYMHLLLVEEETAQERMEMLQKKRNGTLDEIHFKQKQLDRLDYLRYEIARQKQNDNYQPVWSGVPVGIHRIACRMS